MSPREVRKQFIAAVVAGDAAAVASIARTAPDVVNAGNPHGNVPLGDAIASGRLDVVRQLVELGADPAHRNQGGHSMLDAAAFGGHADIARYLVDQGVAPSILHLAALGDVAAVRAGNVEAVVGLLGFCPPDPLDHNSHTPLALVPELDPKVERVRIAAALLDAGASVDAESGHFRGTVVHRAIVNGHLDLTELLVARSADLNLQDHAGKTPLHDAVAKGVKYVEVLLTGQVDLAARNKDGETPLTFARRRKKKTAAALLEAAGALA